MEIARRGGQRRGGQRRRQSVRRPYRGAPWQPLRRAHAGQHRSRHQALLGNVLDRIITDASYRGHNAPAEHKFRVNTAGQKRRVNQQIKREFKRRAAIEPVIGHLKDDHRMGRNYLAHSSGDAINAILAAVGYNFRRLIQWLRLLMLKILIVASFAVQLKSA